MAKSEVLCNPTRFYNRGLKYALPSGWYDAGKIVTLKGIEDENFEIQHGRTGTFKPRNARQKFANPIPEEAKHNLPATEPSTPTPQRLLPNEPITPNVIKEILRISHAPETKKNKTPEDKDK